MTSGKVNWTDFHIFGAGEAGKYIVARFIDGGTLLLDIGAPTVPH
jgi:hypothetical protein